MKRFVPLWLGAALLLAACTAADNADRPAPQASATGAAASTEVAPTSPPAATTAAPEATAAPSETAQVPAETAAPPSTAPATAGAPEPVDPSLYAWEEVASGLQNPLLLTHAGDGSGRLFVVQKTGLIHIVQDGEVLQPAFFDMTGQVSQGYEQGLLGLAFHPKYAQNGMFFINYTDLNGDTHVERCFVSESDPNQADEESCTTVLTQDQPYPNHNGGHLAFGPDGFLYVALGDGGSGGDPQGNAQNLQTLLGKLLRLEVDGDEAPYTAAPGNPFIGRDDARWEIWAYGLRNPWRFSFDRATGDLYIGDVGQDGWEEVNYQPANSAGGENYGWDYLEGGHPFEGNPPADAALVGPVAEYALSEGHCAVTSGYVYRGPSLPALNGVYFYGDFCSGVTWTLARDAQGNWQSAVFQRTPYNISSFGEDEAGELYLTDLGGGRVLRLAGSRD